MRIIRVFPRRTSLTPEDTLAFVGYPMMFLPKADEVHVSCCFTWDKPEAVRLRDAWSPYYPVVKLGGPAFDDPGNGFTPGLYVKSGVTFTSRGCNNQCPWCLVPEREGKLRELPILVGNIIQDNNFLQCSFGHREKVFYMLRSQNAITFAGGLDTRLLTDYVAEEIRGLRIHQLFLACDSDAGLKPLEQAIRRLQMPQNKVRCYVLLAFNQESISRAEERLKAVYEIGALPFAQLYQPADRWIEYPPEWRHLARTWSRPAAMRTFMKKVKG